MPPAHEEMCLWDLIINIIDAPKLLYEVTFFNVFVGKFHSQKMTLKSKKKNFNIWKSNPAVKNQEKTQLI